MEEFWQEFRKGVDETSQKILGLEEKGKTNWISGESWQRFKNAVSCKISLMQQGLNESRMA